MGRLARAINIEDLRALAHARLPRMVFDYIDGGADDERTLRQSVERLRAHELVWDALVDISKIDTATTIMGQPSRVPFLISPTAASRLFHIEGERAVARAAHRAGMIYAMSTLASTSIEEIATVTSGPKWFQVYVWKDRGLMREVLARAKAAGFGAIILTVDVPVAGNRERDPRNGFTVPPSVNWKTATQALARPVYLWNLLTHPRIEASNFVEIARKSKGGIREFIDEQFDRTVTWKDAQWLREEWGSAFAVKGIATPDDARRCVDIGTTAVWISNHGGRQIDTAPATIDLLPEIVDAVQGKAEVIFDGGIRRGSDIVKALALGAKGVAIGRAYLWGLAAGGEKGVTRAIEILEADLSRTLALIGCPDMKTLSSRFVRVPR